MGNEEQIETGKKKKTKVSTKVRLSVCISIIIIFTVVSLILSFLSVGGGDIKEGWKIFWNAFVNADWRWLLGLFGMVILSILLDALIIFIFGRLYTRKYNYGQAIANSMVGTFYSALTPGGSGGQFMQSYIMKRQGIRISNAASIFVMYFILYQINLIIFDVVSLAVEWERVFEYASFEFHIGSVSMTLLPLIIIGFVFNLVILGGLFLLSYSHKFHNWFMNKVVNIGHKLKLVRDPDGLRESLHIQVENFKIELKRLQTNIPVAILISIIMQLMLFVKFSFPYFAASAFHATGEFSFKNFTDTCFLSAFHQMVTGLFPIPGAAGVSELFYGLIYQSVFFPTYDSAGYIIRDLQSNLSATQILWRAVTYHILVIITGLVSIACQVSPSKEYQYASKKNFVTIQHETYEIRKLEVEKALETKQINRQQAKEKMKNLGSKKRKQKNDEEGQEK